MKNTNLPFNVIAVGCQELGLLVESREVVVEVWWIGSGPIKVHNDHKKKKGQFHLESNS